MLPAPNHLCFYDKGDAIQAEHSILARRIAGHEKLSVTAPHFNEARAAMREDARGNWHVLVRFPKLTLQFDKVRDCKLRHTLFFQKEIFDLDQHCPAAT